MRILGCDRQRVLTEFKLKPDEFSPLTWSKVKRMISSFIILRNHVAKLIELHDEITANSAPTDVCGDPDSVCCWCRKGTFRQAEELIEKIEELL